MRGECCAAVLVVVKRMPSDALNFTLTYFGFSTVSPRG